ncbi:hypothetical protein P691DRAFT_667594, partial [Macrolepiota fuliginosa MF-IS2]
KLYIVDVMDVTMEHKTAKNLFREICTTIKKVEKKWNANVMGAEEHVLIPPD